MSSRHTLRDAMEWRYATKAFDPSRRISDEDFDTILEVLRLSPSSFGLQPWKFIVVQSPEVRKRLGEAASLNQSQIEDASHLVIFAHRETISDDYIDHYFDRIKEVRNQTDEDVEGFYDMVSGQVEDMDSSEEGPWNARQLYLALGGALTAAALLRIDACPMEGIDPEAFDEILELDGTEYTTAVALALGYRSPDDSYATLAKVRFPREEVVRFV